MTENIFGKVDNYLTELFTLEDEVLVKTEESIRKNKMPEHSISPNQGQFLFFLTKTCKARRIIEVGTLGGYSTIWLGRALEKGGYVSSIEIDPNYARIARENIRNAGLEKNIEVITGDALEVLDSLNKTNDQPVDLFFMEADKPNYVSYFKWALKYARKGSLMIADNVIRDGQILDPSSKDEKVLGVRKYLEMLAKNDRVTSSIIQQVGAKSHDGIAVSIVK